MTIDSSSRAFRRSDAGLAAESARHRHERNEARAALDEANRMLLGVWLRGRLRDPADLYAHVALDLLVDPPGRINWARVDRVVSELLAVKPHYAAPPDSPWSRGSAAIDWFLSAAE